MKILQERLCRLSSPEYFSNSDERILYGEIEKFVENYKNLPTKDTILIELNGRKDLTEEQLKNIRHIIASASEEETDLQWRLIQLRSVKIGSCIMPFYLVLKS